MIEDDDTKIQKRDILDFVKGITNDLVQGNDLQQPDKLADKVFHAAFLNLRNYLADTIDECTSLKKKNIEMHAKIEDLKKTVNNLKNEYYHSTETIEKLRDNIDLKESNQRILEHELKKCKEYYKDNNTKHTASLKEYDNVANEMKLQIEFLEKSNSKLSGTIEHLQEKMKRERCDIEREKDELYQGQVTYQKNSKNYEKKVAKFKLEKWDLEKGKEEMHEARISHQKSVKAFEKKLVKMQQERSVIEKEELDLKRKISFFQKEKLDFQAERADLQREKLEFDKEKLALGKEISDLEIQKSDVERKNHNINREQEELYQAQMTYQVGMEDFERALTKYNYDKAELKEALKQFNYEKTELKKEKVQLRMEQENCKESVVEYQDKLTKLIEELCDGKYTEKKLNTTDKLTNHLLQSLEKVEKLQNNLEDKMSEINASNVQKGLQNNITHSVPMVPSSVNMQSTVNPINEAMSVISSIPVRHFNTVPCQPSNDINNTSSYKVDQSSMNPAMLSYNDLSSHFNNQQSPPLTANDARHVSFKNGTNNLSSQFVYSDHPVKDFKFCNIKEHTKVNNNINKLRDALLQRKGSKKECDRSDMKWDLCRLEAKIGDAVLKRSLYHNLDRQPRT